MSVVPWIWHSKFYIDGYAIYTAQPELALLGNSYSGSALLLQPLLWLLQMVGVNLNAYGILFDYNWFFANITFALIYWLLLAIHFRSWPIRLTWGSILLLLSVLSLYAPFYASVNKDIVPFGISVCVLAIARHRGVPAGLVSACVLFVIYGLIVRSYFILLAVLTAVTYLSSRRIFLMGVTYALGSVAVLLVYARIPREIIDSGRAEYLEGISATRISYLFDDVTGSGFVLNRAFAFLRLMFPVELFAISPAYGAFVAFKCAASVLTLAVFVIRSTASMRFVGSVVLSYSVVQALFEPDFGSAFRHFIAMLPFVLTLHAQRSARTLGERPQAGGTGLGAMRVPVMTYSPHAVSMRRE